MALVAGYKYDLFISHSHHDNQPLASGRQGWVTELHQGLQRVFEERFEKQLRIWRDPYLDGMHVAEKELAERVTGSALLLTVLSPSYLASEWCRKERDAFSLAVRGRGGLSVGDRSRLIKAVKSYVGPDVHPTSLKGSISFEFYENAPLQPIEFSPETNLAEFNGAVTKLAQGVEQLIAAFPPPPSADAFPREKTIYLAETSFDCDDDRALVKSELELNGYLVLPDEDLPPKAPAQVIEEKIRAYLKRSGMSVMMAGASYGHIPPLAGGRSIVRIQYELAFERSADPEFRRIIWIPMGLKTLEKEQEDFVSELLNAPDALRGAELVQDNIETLKSTIHDLLRPKPEPRAPASNGHNGQNPARVYLVYDEPDYPETRPIRKHLLEQQLEVLIPIAKTKAQDLQEHKELLLLADAVMVYYGRASDEWSRQKLRDLHKLAGYGPEKPLLAKAFYLSDPQTEEKDDFITYEAMIIRSYQGFRAERLAPFIDQIKDLLEKRNAARTGQKATPGIKTDAVRLFYSYAHRDEALRNELETHLKLMQRHGLIEAWHDRQIGAADDWKQQIDENLERADIILLLVSADFMASDYCFEKEMRRALARHDKKTARVIPVIVRDVDWKMAPFAHLQALPTDGKPVTSWGNRDEAWRNVSEGIKKVAEQMRGRFGR